MVQLALDYSPDQPIPLAQVAEKQGISEGYLEHLMTSLRKKGLVRSVRGPQGGYLLTREPAKITAGEIIRCLEGPLSPTGCVSEGDPEICARAEACVTRLLWEKIRQSMAGILDSTTLADLSEDAEKIRISREADMYYI